MASNVLGHSYDKPLIRPTPTHERVSNDTDMRTSCPGWPSGSGCGLKAGTPYTTIYCERCDLKRRDHIAAVLSHGGILTPSAPEPEPTPIDWGCFTEQRILEVCGEYPPDGADIYVEAAEAILKDSPCRISLPCPPLMKYTIDRNRRRPEPVVTPVLSRENCRHCGRNAIERIGCQASEECMR